MKPEELSSLKIKVAKQLDADRPRMEEISRFIHANPELGYQEFKASQRLAEELRSLGYGVEIPAAGMETAFVARAGAGNGPTVAILAEYDALPEVDQAGGHNLIAAACVGVAAALKEISNDLPGNICIIGCPAEQGYPEGAGGKVNLLAAGVFRDVDAAIMIHPSDRFQVWSKPFAREHFKCRFKGRRARSAENPRDLVNAVDPAVMTLTSVWALQRRLPPDVVVQYVISEGGEAPNVMPVEAELRFYVRARRLSMMEEVVNQIKACAQGAAAATGTEVSFAKRAHTYADGIPNLVLARLFERNLRALGIEVEPPALSAQRSLKGLKFSSTDLGNVSREVPAGTIHIGMGYGGLHTTHDRAQAIALPITPGAHDAMMLGSKCLAWTAIDLLAEPSLVTAAQQELSGYRTQNYEHPYPSNE
ncbi:MAG: amidohydrolase [Deltaproteobacteria bacterium]|nr:amidohydrolase [Deltaproteobacteria bacterium]